MIKSAFSAHRIDRRQLKPLRDTVIVGDMNFEERLSNGGIVLVKDNGKSSGIRPRWAQVYAVGHDQTDVQVGEWVFVEHGRWTRGIEVEVQGEAMTLRRVDPKNIIFVSDEPPAADDTISTAVPAQKKSLY
jgi:co-chaperonin GroES (HSP10)